MTGDPVPEERASQERGGAGPAAGPPSARGRRSLTGQPLRIRLTLITAGLLCLTLALGALALTAVLAWSRIAALDDISAERVRTVAALAAGDRLPEALPVAEPGEIAQLLDTDGLVLASSTNASRTLPVLPLQVVHDLVSDGAGDDGPVTAGTGASAYDGDARVAVVVTTYQGQDAYAVVSVPLAEVQGVLRALAVSLVVIVPLLTLLLAGAIWIVLGRALRPVEQLRGAAEQVAHSGGPGSLPVPRADDELGALARTLNEMLDRLEVAARRQRTFVADAAHELRSPLAALRAGIDVARAHPSSYTTDELGAESQREVLRMQALVDDLLLLSRVGSSPPAGTDVDLAELAGDAVQDSAGADAGAGSAVIEVGGKGRAVGDPATLVRVLRNIVDNAARHALTSVQVWVWDGRVVVDDDGEGIDVADRERVFERFVRLEPARERQAGGAGLGLAIAREIAREQGGDVWLEASPLGGVRAVFTVPTTDAGRSRLDR